jgi:hypothetical protein
MQTPSKLSKYYDHVLIGFNMASLQLASLLSQTDESFCIVDSRFYGTGPFKMIPSLGVDVFTRPNYNSALDGLDMSLIPGAVTEKEAPPLTFDKGDFRSFIGFGSGSVHERDVVEKYCQARFIQAHSSPEEFWQQQTEAISAHLYLDQNPTDLIIEDGTVQALGLNGNSQVKGGIFYFFTHLHFLFEHIGPLAKKITSQFAKAPWWSSANLIIHHKNEPEGAEQNQLYLLKGSKEQACLGEFSRVQGQLISRWESFFPAELTPDSETTGSVLKEIKKQVKRAFPNTESDQDYEHILIHNQIHADLSHLGLVNGIINNINNLVVSSHLLQPQVGWLHELAHGLKLFQQRPNTDEKNPPSSLEVAAPSPTC